MTMLILKHCQTLLKQQICENYVSMKHITLQTEIRFWSKCKHFSSQSRSNVQDKEHKHLDDIECRVDLDKPRPESNLHMPVMVKEVMNYLKPKDNQTILDMTFGAGGHSAEILHRAPGAKLLVLDRDPCAHSLAKKFAKKYKHGQVTPLLGRFSELPALLSNADIQHKSINGALLDVGTSSMQFDSSERGFGLSQDGPLDMRMDGVRFPDHPSAADVVNRLGEMGLYEIIKKYGEEKHARRIANIIVESRNAFGKITTTKQLANIIAGVFDESHKTDRNMRQSHVATKTFQALRIFVNNELNELHNGLECLHPYMTPGGCCVALTFHSLEDRIVKRHFHGIDVDEKMNLSHSGQYKNSLKIHSLETLEDILHNKWKPLSKGVVIPSTEESYRNQRSRSAKLRAAIKC